MIACTSTLELGIDVGDLDRVLQAEAPSTVSSFLQRMGRTGRRPGSRANTVFFCQHPETVLQAAAIIELARERWVESVPVSKRCWPVLVHQTLALCLQYGAVSAENVWKQLAHVPDFSGISEAEFTELIDHMIAEEFLFSSGGLLTTIGDWYRALNKPHWQPPDWLFGPAWTVILGLAAWAFVLCWDAAAASGQTGQP